MKIPFDIKYRPEIESGRYKVVTGTGLPVEIVHWDLSLRRKPILAVISYVGGKREHRYDTSGMYYDPGFSFSADRDLFILTDEPILSEFEQAVLDAVGHFMKGDYVYPQRRSRDGEKGYDDLQRVSSELLSLARRMLGNGDGPAVGQVPGNMTDSIINK